MGVLQAARLDAINRLGDLAVRHQADDVLVAGDVFDAEALGEVALRQPLERMRSFPQLRWHLLPGNHDPQRPHGLWDRLRAGSLPDNIILHTAPQPWVDETRCLAILPAPLNYRSTLTDPTAWMDAAATPAGYLRVGLAHGSVTEFGSEAGATGNRIDPRRVDTARLDYLALGDWHGLKRIGPRVWYSGTPETDGFDVDGGGQALLVTLTGPGDEPVVESLPCGRFHWHRETVQLACRDDIDALDQRLRNLSAPLHDHLVQLTAEGALSLDDQAYFDQQIRQGVAAALRWLRLIDDALLPRPTAGDLAGIGGGGFVRLAAERLAAMAQDPANPSREVAARALERLYIEHSKLCDSAS